MSSPLALGLAGVNPQATDDPAPPLSSASRASWRPTPPARPLLEIPEETPSSGIPVAPELRPELIQESVQIQKRKDDDCTPPKCENCKNNLYLYKIK